MGEKVSFFQKPVDVENPGKTLLLLSTKNMKEMVQYSEEIQKYVCVTVQQ